MRALANGNSSYKQNHGFSLIELLIVMIIVIVVAAMAIPAWSSIMRNLRGNGDLRSINGDIMLAKMRAGASFTRARLRANLTANTFQVELWNKTGNSWDVKGGIKAFLMASVSATVRYLPLPRIRRPQ